MAANPARFGLPKSGEPVIHELPPIHIGTTEVSVRLAAWRAEDGAWRGRLVFGPRETDGPATADIFCATTESDLWESVRDLREHHLRDLYRSLVP
jgi:hypothetical protein